jgi:ribosomal protein S12 methylthiotransferase accessory factor
MIVRASSLRSVPPEVTLAKARDMAKPLGVTRVTDITRLDNVDIPVSVSVRPTASRGSLCVNAGKGVTSIDAEVGAWMEGIEFALAEPDAGRVEVAMGTVQDVLDSHERPDAILDLCPVVKRIGDLRDMQLPLACAAAEDLVTGDATLVPAELVLFPYMDQPGTGCFGSHTNGLASGNTVAEATLHALLETIERDARSFNAATDRSRLVKPSTLPSVGGALLEKIKSAGLDISVHVLPSAWDFPVFEAILWDPAARVSVFMNGGWGCHAHKEIAMVRAITETIQSRLSWIHGGRDDLEEVTDMINVEEQGGRDAAEQFRVYSNSPDVVDYDEVRNGADASTSIEKALESAIASLVERGIRQVCRVVLTRPDEPLQVVRVIVPKLEFFTRSSHRMGPRLGEFMAQRNA